MAFTLGVISHYFKVSDPMVGIIGCVSQVKILTAFSGQLAYSANTQAHNVWHKKVPFSFTNKTAPNSNSA